MKQNLFTETILAENWKNLSDKERKKTLQQFEHENSAFQGRTEREVVLDNSYIHELSPVTINYDTANDIIIASNTKDCPVDMAISTLYGAGFGISRLDYYNNKANLKAFVKIEKEKLDEEYTKQTLFLARARFEGIDNYEMLSSYQMDLARIESSLYMLDKIWDACENEEDTKPLIHAYIRLYDMLYEHDQVKFKNMEIFAALERIWAMIKHIESTTLKKFKQNGLIEEIKTQKIIMDNIKPELNDVLSENLLLFTAGVSSPEFLQEPLAAVFRNNFEELPTRKR